MSHCGICSDMFDGVERIGATPCGHVYHKKCLFKWFDHSETCPECRKKVQRQNVMDLFFNINKSEDMKPPSLGNEVENLKFLLQEKCTEACELLNKNTGLREMVVKHESTITSLDKMNLNLENRNTRNLSEIEWLRGYLKNTYRENAELRKELQNFKTVGAGSQEDAEEVLGQATDEARKEKILEKTAMNYVSCSSPDSDSSSSSVYWTELNELASCPLEPGVFEMAMDIAFGSKRKEKRKKNIVVLDKEKEKVSPVLCSPLPKRRKETDSVSSTVYNV